MAGGGLAMWRRVINGKGRTMTLQRQTSVNPTTYNALSLMGMKMDYRPEQIQGNLRQGDAQVRILNDEISNNDWPGPPVAGDTIIIDGFTWGVQGVTPMYDAATLCGYWLWVRGGR